MSLLPATSHANPTTPFWATAGSGGSSSLTAYLCDGSTGSVSQKITTTDWENVGGIDGIPFTVSGRYCVVANFNVNGQGFNNEFIVQIYETVNGFSTNNFISTNDAGSKYSSTSISTLFNYNVGDDIPVWAFQIKASSLTTPLPEVIVTSYLIFYPNQILP
jgi:hypothetical protein